MGSSTKYRDGDFDLDRFLCRTASCPEGLSEYYRFVPNLETKIRRTSSVDEIARFARYYKLVRQNTRGTVTWRQYLRMLLKDLKNFDMGPIGKKVRPSNVTPTPSCASGASHYLTASESEVSPKKFPRVLRQVSWRSPGRLTPWRKRRDNLSVGGDNESLSSMDSTTSVTPQANLLRKMCTEIRSLAHKTCKTVEKMSSKSKYCSSCGDYMGSSKPHQKCSQIFGDGSGGYKPMNPDGIKITKTVKTKSVTFISPMKKSPRPNFALGTPRGRLSPYPKRI